MKPASIFIALALAGCASAPAADPKPAMPSAGSDARSQLQPQAQAIVDGFAAEVRRARGAAPGATPVVKVESTPQMIFFDQASNTIVVPPWSAQPPELKAVVRRFSGGTEADAERFFVAFFSRFLVAHEAGHWFQAAAGRREKTLYENERQANRLAVAYWRTQPGGEAFLAQLEAWATRAAQSVPDPTPPGEDAVAYFGANYQALGQDPVKYGDYQFRFMADALRERLRLDFAAMTSAGK